MKTTNKVLALLTLLTAASQGATSITGIVGGTFRGADNATSIPVGSLALLVVDSGNGFLDQALPGVIVPSLTAQSGKSITSAQAGLSVSTTFGGDTIISTITTTAVGQIGGLLTGFDITPYVNKNFAVVWFSGTPTAGNIAGQSFGMIRLADWTLPASDAGSTFTMSSTDASGATSFYSTSGSATATQVGGGFFTGTGVAADTGSTAVRGMTFSVAGAAVPEPSAALLGAIGALGLLRRRRN